jgi:hypothetical protein
MAICIIAYGRMLSKGPIHLGRYTANAEEGQYVKIASGPTRVNTNRGEPPGLAHVPHPNTAG